MTGKQLKMYLREKEVMLTELAKFLNTTPQNMQKKLNSEGEDLDFNRKIANYLKVPLSELIPDIIYGALPEGTENMVNEPGAEYVRRASPSDLHQQLIKVFEENVTLHKTVADRGEFILKLIR